MLQFITIEIVAMDGFLSAEELVKSRSETHILPLRGLKRVTNTNSEEEQNELTRLQADLRSLISQERIERTTARAKADLQDNGDIVVTSKINESIHNFGRVQNGKYSLEPIEAMYLVEINRLEVYKRGVILSLEHLYHVLIPTGGELAFEKYFVYTNLMKSGYFVRKFKTNVLKDNRSTGEKFVWHWLKGVLGLPNISPNVKPQEDIKKSIEDIIVRTKSQSHFNSEILDDHIELFSSVNRKRKISLSERVQSVSSKRMRIQSDSGSILEDLMNFDSDHKEFSHIFSQINIIELNYNDFRQHDLNDDSNSRFKFDFDLYLPGRKRKNPPDYRLVVLKLETQLPPKHSDICQLYSDESYCRTPIIFIYVNEVMASHAYLYKFSI